ncbi:MAG: hypothetical protein LC792_15775 [Actinobacteria bacterium]|nr:hypothetical protein [Actinomycetota bacterium]
MGLFDTPYDQQLAIINRRQIFNSQLAAAQTTASPQVAAGTVAQSQAYPWVSPQTAYALGANGNQPGDQVSQAVATASLNRKGGGFWHSLGQVVTAPLRSAVHLGSVGISEAQHYGKAAARDALTIAETPLQVGMGAFRDVTALAGGAGDIVGGALAGAGTGAAIGALSGGGVFSWLTAPVGAAIGGVAGGVSGALAQQHGYEVKGGFVNPLAQSSGGVAIGQALSGKGVDLGSGFLPGGTVREQQVKHSQDAASINGHALTPGRMLASGIFRPGTTPYNVMSGVTDAVDTWELDPARYALEGATAARAASRVIPGAAETAEKGNLVTKLLRSRAGILDSADPLVHEAAANEFLTSDRAAQRFIDRAVTETSPSAIRAASKGTLPSDIANQLAATSDRQGVLDVLLNGVNGGELKYRDAVQSGRGVMSSVQAFKPAARLASTFDRLGGTLPEHSVDLNDLANAPHKLDTAVDQLDNWMKQVRFPAEERAPILDRLMQSTTGAEAKAVMTDTIHGNFRQWLTTLGVDEAEINRVLKTSAEDERLLASQHQLEIANHAVPDALDVGGSAFPVNPTNLEMEGIDNTFHFPDPKDLRDMRRITTPTATPYGKSLSALYNSDQWKSSLHSMEWAMGKWKIGNLARPALASRMLIADHARAVANGLETGFSNPLSTIRMLMSSELRPQFWEGIKAGTPLAQAEEYQKAMSNISGNADVVAAHQVTLTPDHPDFPRQWSNRIAELHADPVTRAIAQDGYEATAQSFWDGPLADERLRLAGDPKMAALENDREAADAYVHETLKSHITGRTADNPDLMKAIATGRIEHEDGSVTHLLTLDHHAEEIQRAASQAVLPPPEAIEGEIRQWTDLVDHLDSDAGPAGSETVNLPDGRTVTADQASDIVYDKIRQLRSDLSESQFAHAEGPEKLRLTQERMQAPNLPEGRSFYDANADLPEEGARHLADYMSEDRARRLPAINKLGRWAEGNPEYQAKVQQVLADLPDRFTVFRGDAGTALGGEFSNVTLKQSVAERFAKDWWGASEGGTGGAGKVNAYLVDKADVVALGAGNHQELILRTGALRPVDVVGQAGAPLAAAGVPDHISKMADVLRAHGADLESARQLPKQGWRTIAQLAGVDLEESRYSLTKRQVLRALSRSAGRRSGSTARSSASRQTSSSVPRNSTSCTGKRSPSPPTSSTGKASPPSPTGSPPSRRTSASRPTSAAPSRSAWPAPTWAPGS